MKISENELSLLREAIKLYMRPDRYQHTLGVEELAKRFGEAILPESIEELQAAALLHDITKELSYSEQINILDKNGVSLTSEDLDTAPALHSFTASYAIRDHFPRFATENVLSAVSKHTLGSNDMSVFDKIIFVADFAEPGRKYESCIRTALYLEDFLFSETSNERKLESLDASAVMAIEATVESVKNKKQKVHSNTLKFYEKLTKNL